MLRLFLCALLTAVLLTSPLSALAQEAEQPALPLELKEDLNSDGTEETVKLDLVDGPYGDPVVRVSLSDDTGKRAEYITEIWFLTGAFVVDLDPEDGLKELAVSGDVMSGDYYTWILRWDGSELTALLWGLGDVDYPTVFIPGQLLRAEGTSLILLDKVDVLGSWWGWRPCALSPDGTSILPVEDATWKFDLAEGDPELWDRALTLKLDLPYEKPEGGEGVLSAGTRFLMTETDGASLVRFLAEDGTEGSFAISPSGNGWGFDIQGKNEEEWFEFLPYFG